MPKEIHINPLTVKPGTAEAAHLASLIETLDSASLKSQTFKLTKTRGLDRRGKKRNKDGYDLGTDTVHLEDYSLIRFPNSDRYYVIGRQIGEGAMGKVKILPVYFTKNPNGELVRHEDPNREEVIKIFRQTKQNDAAKDAQKEAELARKAGGVKDAVSGSNTSGKRSGYAKLPKASGTDLEVYLQNNPNLTLKERTKMIRLVLEELQKIRKRGYYYVDIKPENIFYDGKKIQFLDWGSAGKRAEVGDLPGTPLFSGKGGSGESASQREAYAVAGLIGIILSDFSPVDGKPQVYDQTPVIKPKMDAPGYETFRANYDFSQIAPFLNLKENSSEGKALNSLVENLKDMGSQDVTKRDKSSSNNYKAFTDSLSKLETEIELKLELGWLKKLVDGLEKVFDKSKTNTDDPKHKALQALTNFYNDLKNKSSLSPTQEAALLKLIGDVIETSSAKQEKKIFKSNVISVIKNNLPPDISRILPPEQLAQLNEYQSMNVFRLFDRKRTTAEIDENKPTPSKTPSA